jgi:hypothetical protein
MSPFSTSNCAEALNYTEIPEQGGLKDKMYIAQSADSHQTPGGGVHLL